MYVLNGFDSLPGFLFASYSSENGGSVMKYYDLETENEIWTNYAGIDVYDNANSLDIAENLFGDGNTVIVVGVEEYIAYFNARYGNVAKPKTWW